MAFFKSPNPHFTSVSLHNKEYDVQNGFIEIPDDEISPDMERKLKNDLGFVHSTPDEVDHAVSELDAVGSVHHTAELRAKLLKEMKDAGIKIDGRKSLEWIQERYDDLVTEGILKPAPTDPEKPAEPPVD